MPKPARYPNLMKKSSRFIAITLWLGLFVGFWFYAKQTDVSMLEMMRRWLEFISASHYGPLLLIGLYALNPSVPVPITILTVFSGYMFGAIWGTLYGLVGAMLASSIAYGVGYFLAGERLAKTPLVTRLRERGFETVLVCRLLFLSGDVVNYASGAARISFRAYLAATALGGLPGLLVAVLAGAAIQGEFYFTALRVNGWFVVASVFLMLLGVLVSWHVRRRVSGRISDLSPAYAKIVVDARDEQNTRRTNF
jgi:uncharacterized membrane protein YdjX (TVP38/TMEM64 family)